MDIPRPREYVTTTTEHFGTIKRQILGLLHHGGGTGAGTPEATPAESG